MTIDGRSQHSQYGAMGGRPRVAVDLVRVRHLLAGGLSIKAAAKAVGLGEGTVRRALGLVQVGKCRTDAPAPRQNPGKGVL